MLKNKILFIVFFILLSTSFLNAQRLRDDLDELKRINITEHLGDHIPLNMPVINSKGEIVLLKDFFTSGKPVVFSFAYFECKMLCTQVLTALSKSIDRFDWDSKDKYSIITLSIDSRDKSESAVLNKSRYVSGLEDTSLMRNWHFLTAPQRTIDSLTNAIGFEYYYLEEQDEFAHPAAIFVLSPKGKLSRYLYGLNFEPKDLKFSLMEASEGNVGSPMEQLLLYCYHYDATSNTYTPLAENIMRLGGVLTLIFLGLFLLTNWIRDKRSRVITSK